MDGVATAFFVALAATFAQWREGIWTTWRSVVSRYDATVATSATLVVQVLRGAISRDAGDRSGIGGNPHGTIWRVQRGPGLNCAQKPSPILASNFFSRVFSKSILD